MAERINILYDKKPCYDIVFDKGFSTLTEEIGTLFGKERKICIITDSNVADLYLEEVKKNLECVTKKVVTFVFPAGEEQKNLDTVKDVYEFLIQENFDRHDVLLALGGGVVGDITGFIAATYLRGIDFVQVPTTLLSQADSGIGGKTGVDFNGFKNMVGAFKMPKLVYMNVSVLKSLDDRQYYSGFAEIMKHGLIKNTSFYEWLLDNMYEICDREEEVLLKMLMQSCMIKKLVVEKDPTEKGERALLNFGHTIGHAIEKATHFTMTHGECVALGCVAAAFISWKHNWLAMEEYYEIRDMFVPFNLPISIENIDPEEILRLTKSDKKMENGTIKFILLKKVGKAVIDYNVTDEDILNAVKEILYIEDGE